MFPGLLAAVALAALLPGAAAQTPIKLGVFDPQRVSEQTAIGRRVQSELAAFRDRKQAEIGEKEKVIQELRKQLEQQELSLSPDRRNTMEKDIQRQLLDLQSAREAASRELQLEIAAAQSSFEEKLTLAVERLAKEEGYTLVLDRGMVAWSAEAVDVTSKIIERFNAMFPAETGG
jgi:outer membrane protein